MKILFSFADQSFTATMDDTPSSRDLWDMLPLDLTAQDFSTNEKIATLPRKLSEEGAGPFTNPQPGDLCTYTPWGNLALFHAPYSYSPDLIRLGRLDGGVDPLRVRGTYPLHVSRLP
ncbi:hypothetical protein P775_22825 [Puniceibacterium antarcticum]|uniref:Cyclophilin-like domain-containing protein n=1 Tax=Puniceibacterium antarcticum TaxID=1206336 RepID=A0A2G8R8I3_9RHOB|nr:cyclophilin-like fold protein [Puniceibacterium antarcticum]PIL17865.1 hypothetical protein P775_22825 [Puniceibacterium antarcticum]